MITSYALDNGTLKGVETVVNYAKCDLSSNVYVNAYDLANGDSIFEQFRDGVLESRYYVNRNEKLMQAIYNDGIEASDTIHIYKSEQAYQLLPRSKTEGVLGRIRFQYAAETSGICGAYVSWTKNTGSIKYDVNATYRDYASFAGAIATFLGLPGGISLEVAKTILTRFSIAATAINFIIPPCKLQSEYEEIEYTLKDIDFPDHTNSFFGARYVISEEGSHKGDVYTTDIYYPTTSWGDQNFGATIYNYMFSYSFWKIYAWN